MLEDGQIWPPAGYEIRRRNDLSIGNRQPKIVGVEDFGEGVSVINIGLKRIRRWWQIRTGKYDTPIDGEVPFWVVSLCINIVVILLLARLFLPHADFRKQLVVLGEETEVIEIDDTEIPEIEFNEIDIEELSTDSDEQLEIVTENETPLIEISFEPASAPCSPSIRSRARRPGARCAIATTPPA